MGSSTPTRAREAASCGSQRRTVGADADWNPHQSASSTSSPSSTRWFRRSQGAASAGPSGSAPGVTTEAMMRRRSLRPTCRSGATSARTRRSCAAVVCSRGTTAALAVSAEANQAAASTSCAPLGRRCSTSGSRPVLNSLSRVAASSGPSASSSPIARIAASHTGPRVPGSRLSARSRCRAARRLTGESSSVRNSASRCTLTGSHTSSKKRGMSWSWARQAERAPTPSRGWPCRARYWSRTSVGSEHTTAVLVPVPAASQRAACSAASHSVSAARTVSSGAPAGSGASLILTPRRRSAPMIRRHTAGKVSSGCCRTSSSMPSGRGLASSSASSSTTSSASDGASAPSATCAPRPSAAARVCSRGEGPPSAVVGGSVPSQPLATASSRAARSSWAVDQGSAARERWNQASGASRCSSRRRYWLTRSALGTSGRVSPRRVCRSPMRFFRPTRTRFSPGLAYAHGARSRNHPNSTIIHSP
ncbi:hypothetical protein [Sinomonas atrocyanea]